MLTEKKINVKIALINVIRHNTLYG